MVKIQVDDIKINYKQMGNGFPLVMIHGLNDNLENWDPNLIRELSKKYRLILFDVPGSGRSELSNKEPSIKLFAEETSSLLDILGISKAHVLGLSLGGMIAQEIVLNYPEKVEKLILCSTNCGGSRVIPPSMEVIQQLSGNRTNLSPEDLVRNSVRILFTNEFIENNSDYIENHIQRRLSSPVTEKGLVGQQRAIMNFSTYERLPKIKTPTLILHGKKDVMIPPQNSSILAGAIPNSNLVYLENSAHFLAEEVEKLLQIILEFLE